MPTHDGQQAPQILPSPVMRRDAYQIGGLSHQVLEKATKIRGLAADISYDMLRTLSDNGLNAVLDLMTTAEGILEGAKADSKALREARDTPSNRQFPDMKEQPNAPEWDYSKEILRSMPGVSGPPLVDTSTRSLPSQAAVLEAQVAAAPPPKPAPHPVLPLYGEPPKSHEKAIENQVALLHNGLASLRPRGSAVQAMHTQSPKQSSPLSQVTTADHIASFATKARNVPDDISASYGPPTTAAVVQTSAKLLCARALMGRPLSSSKSISSLQPLLPPRTSMSSPSSPSQNPSDLPPVTSPRSQSPSTPGSSHIGNSMPEQTAKILKKPGSKQRSQKKALSAAAGSHQAQPIGIFTGAATPEPIAQFDHSPEAPASMIHKDALPDSETIVHHGFIHPDRVGQIKGDLSPSVLGKRRHDDGAGEDEDEGTNCCDVSSSFGNDKQHEQEALAASVSEQNTLKLRDDGFVYMFYGHEKPEFSITASEQVWSYKIPEKRLYSAARGIWLALRKKRTKGWDPNDEIMFDYKSSKSTKSFAGELFGHTLLYYDRYLEYCKTKKYNPAVTGRLNDVSLWNQWFALNIWERYFNKENGRNPVDLEILTPKLRQNLLDIGELIFAEESFLKRLRVSV